MNFKLPSLLYVIRAVIFASLLLCLIFMNNVVSSVIFLIAVAFNICDFVVSSKYGIKNYGKINNLFFLIIDRCIVLLPLLFATISGSIAVWVLLILVVFEIATSLYRYFDDSKALKKKIGYSIYLIYNLVLYTSSILYLYNVYRVATYFIFVSSIIAAVYIVYSSIIFSEQDGVEECEPEEEKTKTSTIVESDDSRQNEIVE